MNMEEMNNPLLDDLFAEARVEAPQHSYQATKKALLAGLLAGGAGLLAAKVIASSILKSKFFIMSISAVTVLSSAVIVYTAAVKPNDPIVDQPIKTSTEVVANTPMGTMLPEDLFVEVPPIIEPVVFEDVEPDDSTIVVKADSSEKVEQIIEDVMQAIDIEKIEQEVERAMLSIDHEKLEQAIEDMVESFDGDELEAAINDLIASIQSIDVDIDLDDDNLHIDISRMAKDSAMIQEMKAELERLKHLSIDLSEDAFSYSYSTQSQHKHKDHKDKADLQKKVFTITNQTTEADLEDFNKMATEAGMDVSYNCKVKANRIKQLNMRLKISNENGRDYSSDVHIHDIKKGDSFSFNIIWYEDENGQAVKFNHRKSKTCHQHSSSNCN